MIKALNLGCGRNYLPSNENVDWTNLDISTEFKTDVQRNVLRGLPWNDRSFNLIYCSHVLEHFTGDDLIFIMNEIHRVLKPLGQLRILSPYYKFDGAWMNPDHKSFFRQRSFELFCWLSHAAWDSGIRCLFEPLVLEVAEEMELRVVLKKVERSDAERYFEKVGVMNEFHKSLVNPDFVKLTEGKKFYDVTTVDYLVEKKEGEQK